MRISIRQLAIYSILTALALALSIAEQWIPLALFIPVPGIKLGLANIVTLFALYFFGAGPAFAILIARCMLGSLFAGNFSALAFSLCGGLCAMAVMALLKRSRRLSLFGVSIGGAAAHNTGQIAAAVFLLGTSAPVAYLPALLIVAIFTGALTGAVASALFRAMRNVSLK